MQGVCAGLKPKNPTTRGRQDSHQNLNQYQNRMFLSTGPSTCAFYFATLIVNRYIPLCERIPSVCYGSWLMHRNCLPDMRPFPNSLHHFHPAIWLLGQGCVHSSSHGRLCDRYFLLWTNVVYHHFSFLSLSFWSDCHQGQHRQASHHHLDRIHCFQV